MLAHRPSPTSSNLVSFEAYQGPSKVSQQPKKKTSSSAHSRSAAEHPSSTRATRAWKLVDANRILTKRKYVRKQQKAHSVSGSITTEAGAKAESSDDRTLIPSDQSARSLSWPSPQSNIRTGGLRGNPFACYPDNSPSVHGALDFLVNVIGANAVPGTIHKNGFSPKASAFIHLGFEHDLVFHAVVAFAQGYDEVANTGTTEPSPAVLYHRGRATQLLCDRLKDPLTRADDASILTTFLLVDNVWRYGENDIGRAHYSGLLKMIEMRGGLDKLGVNGVLRSVIEFAEVTDIGDTMRSTITPALPDLKYCRHPFPPQVCGLIARLPEGYAEMAMQGYLSVETMVTIVSLKDWLNTDPECRSPAPHRQIGSARRCMLASKSPLGAMTEEAVCFGLVVTGMRSFHARFARMDHPVLDRIVELGEHFDSQAQSSKPTAERQHIAYITMVAVEASDKCIELQDHVRKLVDLLIKREKFAASWGGMEKAMKRFFWIDFAASRWKECWTKHLRRRAEEQALAKARAARSSEGASIWATMNSALK
ncbi:uncharacterized protein HMPREF1541_03138 [Cyphellophora europaea CBS 101466]|uniref:Uncharacterized protein n=1 Tax=Cyphellophora europaea (strain CBS 101466) TaxID=1220924 RepID=W2RZI6_CYPE1|nr:uncharacterized protein HMPREF1541_03138 [Cyphellophora europaea CBS 101466]ETN41203.1 hypothetical protein HMPREF1541_03138 [Cyphellophora europaea CBS 101466]